MVIVEVGCSVVVVEVGCGVVVDEVGSVVVVVEVSCVVVVVEVGCVVGADVSSVVDSIVVVPCNGLQTPVPSGVLHVVPK